MIILCDVDNVLSDDSWRAKFVQPHRVTPEEAYHDYHMACELDSAFNLHLVLVPKARVFLLTAMPDEYAHLRERWLVRNHIPFERVMYRQRGDRRNAVEVKRAMVRQLHAEGVPLVECKAAYDDRIEIVDMYKSEGLPGIHVAINHKQVSHRKYK